jgi:hypothetical protein
MWKLCAGKYEYRVNSQPAEDFNPENWPRNAVIEIKLMVSSLIRMTQEHDWLAEDIKHTFQLLEETRRNLEIMRDDLAWLEDLIANPEERMKYPKLLRQLRILRGILNVEAMKNASAINGNLRI